LCVNRDPYYATPRAGTLDCADAILPWRVEDPPPPPVPPKRREPSARPAAAQADVPKRVTPWLLRRVKTPAAQDAHVTHDRHLPPSSSANVRQSPAPAPAAKPPSYQQQQQQQQPPPPHHPREETFRVVPRQQSKDDSVAVKAANRPVVVSSIKVLVHTPSKPALPDKPDRSEAWKAPSSSRFPTPQPSVGSLHEERRRPAAATAPRPTRPPLPQAKPSHPPSYHYPEPFPAPPPYRVSPEESSPSPPSGRSRSLPRSRKHSPAFQKDAPLPALPSHPPLSASAMSRVQAAYKVSKQFGDAVMQQEARLAIPRTDYIPPVPVPASTPRTARRFMSAAELDSHRKARLRGDKSSREQEARQRALSKPSFYSERYAGESRQRATSANSGRGYNDTKSRIMANNKR